MNMFLREQDGQTFQSIPVAAFYTKNFQYLWHYLEFPAIYHKDPLSDAMRAARPGESPEQAWDRFMREWRELQLSPFFPDLDLGRCQRDSVGALRASYVIGPTPD